MNRFERGIREQAKVVWEEALTALETIAAAVLMDPTIASRLIGTPQATV